MVELASVDFCNCDLLHMQDGKANFQMRQLHEYVSDFHEICFEKKNILLSLHYNEVVL